MASGSAGQIVSTSASSARPARPWWQRLVLAQEAGLVLVIALTMALLAIFGGSRAARDFVRPDAGTSITESAGAFTATVDGTTRSFQASDGWTLTQRGGTASLAREYRVNKFFNLENLMQVLVNASFIAIMAVGITAVIAMGGIDLSIGSIYALSALVTGIVLRYHWPGGEASLSPTILGSGALWTGLLALGAGGLVASIVLGLRAANPANLRAGSSGRGGLGALATALAAAGIGVLIVVGWQVVRAMRDGWGSSDQASLSLAATLPMALLVGGVVGGLCGLLNGVMIVGLRVHPFIITLGTMAAYRGLCALPTQSQSVGNMSPSYQEFMTFSVAGVNPVPVLIMLGVALAGVFVLSRMVIGRQIYAIGGNETAATYAGIPVGRVKIIVYTMMGVLAGLSGLVYLGYYGAAEPGAGTGYELSVIAAAVIGGASLSGGRGSALGAVLGAILVQLIDNSLIILDIDQNYRLVVIGAAIIAAVVLDQFKARLVPVGR